MKVVCFDLDDTLYKEIDYLKSAFREIAEYAVARCACSSDIANNLSVSSYENMLKAYHEGHNAFDELNSFLETNTPISDFLHIYRHHKPKILLDRDTTLMLNTLNTENIRIGLITDGRSIQQRSKIEALGLKRWMADDDIIISEEFGSEKPCCSNYTYFMKKYPAVHDFYYVGDNITKDFIAPNQLGWNTICLKDDGRNIHKQRLYDIEEGMAPRFMINALNDIPDMLQSSYPG